MSTIPVYSAYSETELEYIGSIPSTWKVTRLKHLVDENRQITYGIVQAGPNVGGGVPYIRPADMSDEGGVTDLNALLRTSEAIANNYRRSAIDTGDLVCSIGPSFGKVMVVPSELSGGNLTQGTARVAISPANSSRFIFWALRSAGTFQQWESSVGGATFRALNLGPLTATLLARPPFDEQSQIAKFLDYETAKIDALIEKQQQLIALLEEKRQAVISHAVTKGLNPDVPMRDSGVEWLGKIPEHWKTGKCGYYASILPGFAFPSTGFSSDERDVKLLRGINVGVARLRWDEVVYWRRTSGDGLDTYELAEGDLVIGMDRPLISKGMRVARVGKDDLPCLLLQRVASIKSGPLLSSRLLMHLLSSSFFVAHFSPETTGVSVPHISPSQIAEFVIPIPPATEQRAILEGIAKKIARIGVLIKRCTAAATLLQERRTALISAAVTGKIDVRGWKPPTPNPEAEAA